MSNPYNPQNSPEPQGGQRSSGPYDRTLPTDSSYTEAAGTGQQNSSPSSGSSLPAYGQGGYGEASYGAAGNGEAAYDAPGYGAAGYEGVGPQSGRGVVTEPGPVDVAGAVGQGTKLFFRNWGAWVGAMVAWTVLALLPLIPLFISVIAGTPSTSYDYDMQPPGAAETLSPWAIAGILISVLALVFLSLWMYGALYRAASEELSGHKPGFGRFFRFGAGMGGLILVFLIYTIITLVGLVLFILPGIVLAILFMWVPVVKAEEPDRGIGHAFSLGLKLATKNPGPTILTAILVFIIQMVGSLIPILGTILAYPISLLAMFVVYRQLTQRQMLRL